MKIRQIIFFTAFIALTSVYVLSPQVRGPVIQSLVAIIAIAAACIALYTSRIYKLNSANGRAMLLIISGLVFWGIAEGIWYVIDNILMIEDLFPSMADVFFSTSIPSLGVGVYQGYKTAGIKLKQVNKSLLTIVLSASLILTALVLYFGVYLAYDPSADLAASIVNIGYGLGDLVLVIFSLLTILVAREYSGGKLASFWKTMAAGFFVMLMADIIFAMYGDLVFEDIKPYVYVDLLWGASYMLIVYGILENYLHISAVQKNIKLKLQQRK